MKKLLSITKKLLKSSSFLVLMAFSLIFIACESNEDTLLIEEQESIQPTDFSKQVPIDVNTIDFSKQVPLHLNTTDGRYTPVPFVATILGNNNRYVSSENGTKVMTCKRPKVGSWEIFIFVPVPDPNRPNQFRIMGNNGRYMRVSGNQKTITCNDYLRNGTIFELVQNDGGTYLRAVAQNKYVSSENGDKPISCNRPWQRPWEKFTIGLLYYI